MPTLEEGVTGEGYWMSVIAKALALICLHNADLRYADIGTQGDLLASLGVKRRDIAAILTTTEETVRVSMRTSKRSGRTKRARGKAKGR